METNFLFKLMFCVLKICVNPLLAAQDFIQTSFPLSFSLLSVADIFFHRWRAWDRKWQRRRYHPFLPAPRWKLTLLHFTAYYHIHYHILPTITTFYLILPHPHVHSNLPQGMSPLNIHSYDIHPHTFFIPATRYVHQQRIVPLYATGISDTPPTPL